MTPLEAAKGRITIAALAHLRGWGWESGRSCRVPYRADRNPSGSVFADGRLFRDFASGETLDAPALLARVEQISNEDACRLLIELAGTAGDHSLPVRSAPAPVAAPRPKCKPDLNSLQLSRLTDDRLHQLA